MKGIKHLIECHCMLKTIQKGNSPIYHKFVVYSKFDDYENIVPKCVKCNNCGTVHYVYEICKSEIKTGKEDISSINTIKDISLSLPDKIVNLLLENDSGLAIYEEVLDVIENSFFPVSIVLQRETIEDIIQIKTLIIQDKDKFKIENNFINRVIKE